MDKPIPTGKIIVTRPNHDFRVDPGRAPTYQETIPFESIKTHKLDDTGYHILYKNHHRFIPYHEIIEIVMIHNDNEYIEQMKLWEAEEHQKHLDSEPDTGNCSLCQQEAMKEAQAIFHTLIGHAQPDEDGF